MNSIADYVVAEVAVIGQLCKANKEAAINRLAKVERFIDTSFFVSDSEKEKLLSALAQIRRALYKGFFNLSKRSGYTKSSNVKNFEQLFDKFNRSLTYKSKILRRKINRLKKGDS